jgi:hypothetical protein
MDTGVLEKAFNNALTKHFENTKDRLSMHLEIAYSKLLRSPHNIKCRHSSTKVDIPSLWDLHEPRIKAIFFKDAI